MWERTRWTFFAWVQITSPAWHTGNLRGNIKYASIYILSWLKTSDRESIQPPRGNSTSKSPGKPSSVPELIQSAPQACHLSTGESPNLSTEETTTSIQEAEIINSSVSRTATLELICNRSLPFDASMKILSLIHCLDASSVLGLSGHTSWPSEFAPEEGKWGSCSSLLDSLWSHLGWKVDKKGELYLLRKMNPFYLVNINVCFCTSCKHMRQVGKYKNC